MTSIRTLLEQSEVEESSTLPETKMAKRRRNSVSKSFPFGPEYDSKNPGNSPLARPAKRSKKDSLYRIAVVENDPLNSTLNELEGEIEDARYMIHNHFENMKAKMDNDEQEITRGMEEMTSGGLASINGGKNPQNEFIVKGLIDNFEEIIGNIGLESKRDVDLAMEDIKKTLTKLINQLKLSVKPRPCIDIVKVTRMDIVKFLWIGFWSAVVLLISVFPDYPLQVFESAVAFYQSATLAFILFCMLCLCKMGSK